VLQQWFLSDGVPHRLYSSWSGHINEGCSGGCIFKGHDCGSCTAIAKNAFVCLASDYSVDPDCAAEFTYSEDNLCSAGVCRSAASLSAGKVLQIFLPKDDLCWTVTMAENINAENVVGTGYAPCLPCSGGFSRTGLALSDAELPGHYGVWQTSGYVNVELASSNNNYYCAAPHGRILCSSATRTQAGVAECDNNLVNVTGNHQLGSTILINGHLCTFVGPRVVLLGNSTVSGLAVVNVSALLSGKYESALFTKGPTHAATIWGAVSALWVMAALGVVACTSTVYLE
jgi:hypothetical protein